MGREKTDVPAGVFIAALVVLLVSLVKGWVVLVVVCAAVMVGVLVATARRRRQGPAPEETLRPGGEDRPWRRAEDQ